MAEMKFRLQNIHFIGIGGSGMNGIAEVLFNLGYTITGSDIAANENTQRLEALGVQISYNHHPKNITNAQAVVVSSAIDTTNTEIIAAQEQKIPIVPRAQMLAEIMRFRFGIAVSGTHGKTTTTSIIASIMMGAGLDPTYIIGGILNADGVGNHLGKSNYLVAEADESDGSFLMLNPMLSVITNIDKDHMQTYDFDEGKLQQAFIDFSDNLPFYGLCIACLDDAGVRAILPNIKRKVLTYGISSDADVTATNIIHTRRGSTFDVTIFNTTFHITLNLIGEHNILNCLAAIAVAYELKIDSTTIQKSLEHFFGAKRRLDYKGDVQINKSQVQIFDDYGHHPSEIHAVISGLKKSFTENNIIVIFQPHRYSRTKDLFDEFALELGSISTLILLPIYSAGETEIHGISSSSLAANIRTRSNSNVIVAKDFNDCLQIVENVVSDNDILLTLGAGDITHIADVLVKKYTQ